MKAFRKIDFLCFTLLLLVSCETSELRPETTHQLSEQIENLRQAHLNSDIALADKLYHPDLVLTSQSGKRYDKQVALKNIENTFESYVNSDIEFVKVSDNVILTNYINERKYKDFDKGTFRLTVVWTKHQGRWQIISMQSLKIKARNTMKTAMLPVINVSELIDLNQSSNPIIVNATSGPNALANYQEKHLDGAFFLDLNKDLSEIHEDAANGGRHPLPIIENFAKTISEIGITPDSHVIIYDDKGGANASARFWWMLKAIGHEKVQVLNGGIQEAEKQQFPINSENVNPTSAALYPVTSWKLPMVEIDKVEQVSQDANHIVVDVRATPRYKGQFEPLDLVAGHIPGSVNVPFAENLNDNGLFKSPDELKEKYTSLFGDTPKENIIFHCGSGVTACHSLLAIAHSGLDIPNLYVGSWSEWSRNDKTIVTETKK